MKHLLPVLAACSLLACCGDANAPDTQLPRLTTAHVYHIRDTLAVVGGRITYNAGYSILEAGICWSSRPSPTLADRTQKYFGSGIDMTCGMPNLAPNTTYHVRAYATTARGTGYGDAVAFTTTHIKGDSLRDIDGNLYHTVAIGTQVWMMENLKTRRYNDGSQIPVVTGEAAWSKMRSPACCTTTGYVTDTYYNWYAVNSGKLAPRGWRVPSDNDWAILFATLGSDVLTKLKEESRLNFPYRCNDVANQSGFTAILNGLRTLDGIYFHGRVRGYWWSSTDHGMGDPSYRLLSDQLFNVPVKDFTPKQAGCSVRLVKDP